jgi:DnaJ-class molecular chaperone
MSAAENAVPDDQTAQSSHEPQPCRPCHGSGKVISSLGGKPRKVTCPWCRGGGVRIVGADAQEYRREQDGATRP